jgi:ABC transporter substrate binding protein
MRRRESIARLAGAAVVPRAAGAQQPGRLPTIGFLGTTSRSAWTAWTAAFVQRLRELGWTEGSTVAIEYRWAEGITERFDAIAAEFVRLKVDVIVTSGAGTPSIKHVCTGPLVNTNRASIGALANDARLPTMHSQKQYVEAGGLICHGPDIVDLFRRAGDYVDKILRGTKPGDLPVQQPTKFEMVINLKTAKVLGLEVSPMLLVRADEVIE